MSVRELYEYALIELNKLKAPSLLLEDYNYFINKAVQQYINLVYNRYDVNQQSTDDLHVLKTTFTTEPKRLENENINSANSILRSTYYVDLPDDYVHMLNCIVEYNINKPFKCYNAGETVAFNASRLTSDMYGSILNNAYLRPMYKRPYYFINDLYANEEERLVDGKERDSIREKDDRTANFTKVRLELRFGMETDLFTPAKVYIDYIKAPKFIRLTMEDINNIEDTTALLEWPDYVCFEIVNLFTKLVMENASDPRLQTNPVINQTIMNPLQGQAKQ